MHYSDLAIKIIDDCLDCFNRHATFGNYVDIKPTNTTFTITDRVRVLFTVPRIKFALLTGLIFDLFSAVTKFFFKEKQPIGGYSIVLDKNSRFSVFHRSYWSDFLIWEAIVHAVNVLKLPNSIELEAISRHIVSSFKEIEENGLLVKYKNKNILFHSYFPRKNHMVPQTHILFKHILSKDAINPDIDTSCGLLGSMYYAASGLGIDLKSLNHSGEHIHLYLDILQEHVYGQGEYGKRPLCYKNSVSLNAPGVFTWLCDDSNEVDITANINILNYLICVYKTCGQDAIAIDYVINISRIILKFLDFHVKNDTFFDPREQMYYPPGSICFFWYRMIKNFYSLDNESRGNIDSENTVDKVCKYMVNVIQDGFLSNEENLNIFDRALILPFQIRMRIGNVNKWQITIDHILNSNKTESLVFSHVHVPYPFRIHFSNVMFIYSALLYTLAELNEQL